MLLQNNATPILTTEEFETTDFSIDQNNLHIVTDILSNRMYRFKARSILREYSANAQDAHWDAGLDEPIHITLPTSMSPILVIRDYGNGMTVDEVKNIFTKYGASTKRQTNKAIGALGMGGKSAFCMTKSFKVIVYKDCEKRTYVVLISERGIPQLNYIGATAQKQDERDGMSIEIPVQKDTISEFTSEMSLFSYWNPKPIIINGDIPKPDIAETSQTTIEGVGEVKYHILQKQHNSGYSYNSGKQQTIVVMGGVPYDTAPDSFNDSELEEFYGNEGSCTIEVPIGTVEVTASRESLEYTPRTIDNLTKIANGIINTAADKIIEEIDMHYDFLSAASYYDGLKGSLPSGIKERLQKHAPAYKGMRLNVHQSPPKGDCTLYKFTWFTSWRSTERDKTTKEQARNISFKNSEYYYLHTEAVDNNGVPTTSPTVYKRAKLRLTDIDDDEACIYVLAGKEEEVTATLKDHELWDSLKISDIKDIELPKFVKGQSTGTSNYVSITGLAFMLNPYGNSKAEMFETPSEDEVLDKEDRSKTVVYLPIHSKKPYKEEPGDWDMEDFKSNLFDNREILEFDRDHGKHVFWVLSKRLLSKIPSHWISWNQWSNEIPQRVIDAKEEFVNAQVEIEIKSKNHHLPRDLQLVHTFIQANKTWFVKEVLGLGPLDFLEKFPNNPDKETEHPGGTALLGWYNRNWKNQKLVEALDSKFNTGDALALKLDAIDDKLTTALDEHPQLYPLLTTQKNYGCKMNKELMLRSIQIIRESICSGT